MLQLPRWSSRWCRGDIAGLRPGQIRYTLLLNESGGIFDDLMIGRSPTFAGGLYIVVNAGTKEGDFAQIAAAAGDHAKLVRGDADRGLLALQGPEAVAVLNAILPGVDELAFMTYGAFDWAGDKVFVSRSGYTGEDGYEILVEASQAAGLSGPPACRRTRQADRPGRARLAPARSRPAALRSRARRNHLTDRG